MYEDLGVRRIINAWERATWVGGSTMAEAVLAAMNDAAGSHVDMFELQRKAGERIAALTRNEAAYVCNGAASGLVIGLLACRTGMSMTSLARLPESALRNEVIVHAGHRTPYDDPILLAGFRLVTIGNAIQTFEWELEAAITDRTAAVLFVAGDHLAKPALDLQTVVRIAGNHHLPVVVDAAAQLPPMENLWQFTSEQGAALATFSGGKDIQGPQASGFIVGKDELIDACAMHGPPHQRYARAMKVGKEEIVGLVKAVELYVALDHRARQAVFEEIVAYWCKSLGALPGVVATRSFPNEAGQPIPRVKLDLEPEVTGLCAEKLHARLWDHEPGIAVGYGAPNSIYLTPDTLRAGDASTIVDVVRNVLAEACTIAREIR